MTIVEARYEYRVWGEHLDAPVAALLGAGESADSYEGEETYLIAPGVFDVNPKLRHGLLDVKVLLDVAEGCERWQPWIKTEMPVPAALLRDQLLPRLGVAPPGLRRGEYSVEELIGEVVTETAVEAVPVAKRRRRFDIDGCCAEYAQVTVLGHRLRTVAIESADLGALVNVRGDLGIETEDNVSYPRMISRIMAAEQG